MKKRSTKYFAVKATGKSIAKNIRITQGNPAMQQTSPNQDDTGGGNDSGKRIDQN